MTDISSASGILALSPLKIPGSISGVKSEDPKVTDPVGVPLVLTAGRHLKVVADPPFPAADSLELHHNGVRITVPFTVDPDTRRTTFEVPRARLREGANSFHYIARRLSDNDDTSPTQWMLYSLILPGGDDPINDDKDIHEGLGIDLPEDVKQNGVDLVLAGRGVPLTVSYAFAKLHDVVTVNGNNNAEFKHTVTQENLGGAFDITLPKDFFIAGGNSKTFTISYTPEDQLGNPTQNSLPSPPLTIKVDLTPKVELPPAPFVPALVGNVISPNKHPTGFVVRVDGTKGFKAGDKAKLVLRGGAAGAGTPVFTFVALNANFRANFQLTPAFILANAGREVVFTWILSSGGKETESEALTLKLESVNVTDPNFPTAEIVEAYESDSLDLRAFIGDARIVCAPWPLIAAEQKYSLHVLGTGIDDNPKTVVIVVNKTLTAAEVKGGLDQVLPRKELKLFKPGHQLRVRLRVDFHPNENADTTVTFRLKRYTLVTAGMKATLEFVNAPYVVAPMGRLTNIELKLVDENGEFIKEALVYLTIPNNFKYADGTTGRREFKTSLFGELVIKGVIGPDAPKTAYMMNAEYAGKAVGAKLNVAVRGKTGELGIGFVPSGYASFVFGTLLVSPDGTKICINKPLQVGGKLAVVDTTTLQVIDGLIDGLEAYSFDIGPDSKQVFMSSSSSSFRVLIDLDFRSQTRIPATSYNSCACVFNREGTHAYVMSHQGLKKTDILLKSEKDIEYLSGYGPIVRSSDGQRIFFFLERFKSLTSIDATTDKVIKSTYQSGNAVTLAISPDGKRLYADDLTNQKIRIIDSTSLLVTHSVDVLKPGVITLSPNGLLLFFASEGKAVKALDTVSLKEVKTFAVAGDPCSLAVSPDGARLYIAYKNQSFITAIQIE